MTERDTEFEFDFFDEPEEAEPTGGEQPRKGPRDRPPRPPARPPAGITPLFRLAGLIAFAIVIIVLLVFWVKSCQGAGKRDAYVSYMRQVGDISKDSEQIGRELNDALTTPGIKAADLEPKLAGLAQREQQNVARAQSLRAPGPLRMEQADMIEALGFEASGLQGLGAAFAKAGTSSDVAGSGILLAQEAQRLVAGDVIWHDRFRQASIDELKRQGITGVSVPDSAFVTNPDFASPRAWVPIVQRLSGASTGGSSGLHGTELLSVKALPSGQQLSTSSENTVTATTDLGFQVTIDDSGDFQEVQIKVTLTIQQTPSPIVKTQTIQQINPKEQKSVFFRNLGQVQFATKTTVKVDVQPVPGEKNTSNNSAQYPVIFSLG
jgi:hypothetical protein